MQVSYGDSERSTVQRPGHESSPSQLGSAPSRATSRHWPRDDFMRSASTCADQGHVTSRHRTDHVS
jgi:hypothetical protein